MNKKKIIIIVIVGFLLYAIIGLTLYKLGIIESKPSEIKEEKKAEKVIQKEEESKENQSNIKGYDLIYAISQYVGQDYELKSGKDLDTYDIYVPNKYDVTMVVDNKTNKVYDMTLITYIEDMELLKFIDELFIDKTEIDNWLEENWNKETTGIRLDGYDILVNNKNGATFLSIGE